MRIPNSENRCATEKETMDDWLSVPPTPETRALMCELLAQERAAAGLEEGELLANADAFDACIRRFAHMVFSLPEAQLR